MNKEFEDLTCEEKMLNQVKRIIKLPGTSFETLINVSRQSMGEEAGDILQQLYQENSMH